MRGDGTIGSGAGGMQLLRAGHREHGGAPEARHRNPAIQVSETAPAGGDAERVPHDRAGRGVERREESANEIDEGDGGGGGGGGGTAAAGAAAAAGARGTF